MIYKNKKLCLDLYTPSSSVFIWAYSLAGKALNFLDSYKHQKELGIIIQDTIFLLCIFPKYMRYKKKFLLYVSLKNNIIKPGCLHLQDTT